MKKTFFLIPAILLTACVGFSQVKIGDNPASINPYSLLELESSNKGILLPRIETTTGLALMSGAPKGMVVFFIPDSSIYIKREANWVKVNSNWVVTGNHIYNENSGNVGVGTSTPGYPLTVKGLSSGAGLVQESPDGTSQVGFWTGPNGAYVQTWTNTDLNFTTGNGVSRMVLKTNGDFTINKSLEIKERLTTPRTGGSNLLPLALGKINFDGTILNATSNMSVVKTGAGKYEISIVGESLYSNSSNYTIQVTPEGSTVAYMANYLIKPSNVIEVNTWTPQIQYTNNACSCDVFSYIQSLYAQQRNDQSFSILIYKYN